MHGDARHLPAGLPRLQPHLAPHPADMGSPISPHPVLHVSSVCPAPGAFDLGAIFFDPITNALIAERRRKGLAKWDQSVQNAGSFPFLLPGESFPAKSLLVKTNARHLESLHLESVVSNNDDNNGSNTNVTQLK